MTILIPVLGDQLTDDLASLRGVERGRAVVLMAEVADEATYVAHHKQKLVLVFAAMRHFAARLRAAGWVVDYVALDAPGNAGSLTGEVVRAAREHGAAAIRVTESGEHRVDAAIAEWEGRTGLPVEVLADDRFYVSRGAFDRWAAKRRGLRMEDFYRAVRRTTGILMRGQEPEGGRWNYDAENRKRPPADLRYPPPPRFAPDEVTRAVMAMVERRFPANFGTLDAFGWPVTREQALEALDGFVEERLPRFGDYQDALIHGQWSMFHALVSTSMNLGLLTAREVVEAAVAAFEAGRAPLNAVEGFVRQVIGWREYIRGVYFHFGPEYQARNALGATRPLPGFYWTGNSGMDCVDQAVRATRDHAYAHHIQRLMVLGNFAMLAGIDPAAVQNWYLVVYADAYEWVESPNVVGMSQFADGGALASKPYAAGGAYINRMGDHCRHCRYDVSERVGPKACPFNSLYWNFLDRHRDRFERNPRMTPMYRNWDRFPGETQAAIRARAAQVLDALTPDY